MQRQTWGIIGAGQALGSSCWGQIEAPHFLRKLGLIDVLRRNYQHVSDFGDCEEKAWLQDFSNPKLKNFLPLCEYLKKLYQVTLESSKIAERLLVFGGDHSISIATIAARLAWHKKARPDLRIAVLWIDGHPDINTADTTPSGNMHGMIVSSLLGYGPIDVQQLFSSDVPLLKPEEIVYLGLRDLDPEEEKLIRQLNILNVDENEIRSHGIAPAVAKALNYMKQNNYHFITSFDIDVCDPLQIPAVCTVFPGGLSLNQAEYVADQIAMSELCLGVDMVEFDAEHPYATEVAKFMIELSNRIIK